MPPIRPMLAKSVSILPEGMLYEPKWDGFRCVVFRDGDEVELGSRKERPLTRYFPEIVEAAKTQLPATLRGRRRDRDRQRPRPRLRGAAPAHPPGRLEGEHAGHRDPGHADRLRPAGHRRPVADGAAPGRTPGRPRGGPGRRRGPGAPHAHHRLAAPGRALVPAVRGRRAGRVVAKPPDRPTWRTSG